MSVARSAGIDIGSRSVELVVLENGGVVTSRMTPSGFDPLATASALLDG